MKVSEKTFKSRCGGMVDTRHLKCRGRKPVPVQVRPAVRVEINELAHLRRICLSRAEEFLTRHIWRSGRSRWPHKPIPFGHRRFESCFMHAYKKDL